VGLAIGLPGHYYDPEELLANYSTSLIPIRKENGFCLKLADCLYPKKCRSSDTYDENNENSVYRFWISPAFNSGACTNSECYFCRYRPFEAVATECPEAQVTDDSNRWLPDGGKFRCYWANLLGARSGSAKYEDRDCAEFVVRRTGNMYIEYSFGNVPC
jgi:hypothetical protein